MKCIYIAVLLCCFTDLSAQDSVKENSSGKKVNQKIERNSVREGNKLYSDKKYTESEIEYRKALDANPNSWMGMYNLGNSLFRQGKYDAALDQYKNVASLETDSIKSSQAWYNMGNVLMQDKKYAESIDAYKNALRRNPKDDEARYNLRLAQLLLKKQQQDQKNQDQNKDQNKDNKDKKDQNKENEDQNKNQQQNPKDNKQDKKEQQKQQSSSPQMSKENAQQILDAMQQDERNTQEKVRKAMMQQQKRKKTDKEW